MLRVGQKNLIAPTKQRARPGGGHQIDSLGAAASPDNLFRLGRIDELGDSLTRALIALKCTSRQGVQGRARVGVVMPIEILDRIHHGCWTLGGRGTVEIDEWLTVHELIEYRKIFAPGISVVADRFRLRSNGGNGLGKCSKPREERGAADITPRDAARELGLNY